MSSVKGSKHLREHVTQALLPLIAGHAFDRAPGPAPSREFEPEVSQLAKCSMAENAGSQDRDAAVGGLCLRNDLLPHMLTLLVDVKMQVAMERQHCHHNIFHHHPGNALVDHAHEFDILGYDGAGKLVDAGTDAEHRLEVLVAN